MTSKALVYGDVSPNVIDGSSIWLMSITETLSRIFDETHLQLKMPVENGTLLSALDSIPSVVIHDVSGEKPLSADQAVKVLETIHDEVKPDVLVARGMDLCFHLSKSKKLREILWAYVTDLPFPVTKISKVNLNRLNTIATNSFRMFAQTEAARSYLESITPNAAGKTCLLPPMIPESTANKDSEPGSNFKMVYSGKLAKDWKTLEMLEIPTELKKLGIASELLVVGSKINASRDDPGWAKSMRDAIEIYDQDPKSGVRWLGAKSRAESMALISQADLGIGWRSSVLDSSLEISTKTLEYSSLGVPSLANKNADNCAFFPDGYDLFVSSEATAADAARVIKNHIQSTADWSSDLCSVAKQYSMAAASNRLERLFQRNGCLQKVESVKRTKVLIASHDFKFMGELIQSLKLDPNFELKIDSWDGLSEHDEKQSSKLADWADVIFCEWAGPSVNFFAERKRPGQRLITRLHGFEVRRGKWLLNAQLDKVDKIIFVSDYYRSFGTERLNFPLEKTTVIPNAVDVADLCRPKLDFARFTIGMVGIVPFLKRPDKALDVLEILLKEDSRFILRFKGRAPWEYPYEWNSALAKQQYLTFFSRINQSEILRHQVVFDQFSPDIGNWLRGVGFILSPSDHESFHLAPAEGMASGAIPLVWEREGAVDIFGQENCYPDAEAVADQILSIATGDDYEVYSSRVTEYATRWDIEKLISKWKSELIGFHEV